MSIPLPPPPEINGISPTQLIDKAAERTPDMSALADRFAQLMAHDPAAQPGALPALESGPTALANFVQSQETMLKQTFADVHAFTAAAPTMDTAQLMSQQIGLQYQISMVHMQFNAGVYVAQSSKSGLQTLMKNQ